MITRLDICQSCEFFGEKKTETSVWCKALGTNPNCQLCTAFTTASSKASGGCPKGFWPDLPEQDPGYVPPLTKGRLLVLERVPAEKLESSEHCIHYAGIKGKQFGFCRIGVYASMPKTTCMKCPSRTPRDQA